MAKKYEYLAYAYRITGDEIENLEILNDEFAISSRHPMEEANTNGWEWALREVQKQIDYRHNNWKLNGIWLKAMLFNRNYSKDILYLGYGDFENRLLDK